MHNGPASAGGVAHSLWRNRVSVENGLASAAATSLVFSSAPGTRREADLLNSARKLSERGDQLARRGHAREATDCYRAALRLTPEDGELHYKFACTVWNTEPFEVVEGHLLEAERLAPANAAVQESLALWFLRTDRLDLALNHVEAALAEHPSNVEYQITRADVLAAAGQEQQAWTVIAPLVAAGENSLWLARVYSRIAPKIGQEAGALAFEERLLETPDLARQDQSRIHFAAAALLEKIGRFDEAFQHAQRANQTSAQPFDAAAHTQSISSRIRYYTRKTLRSLPRATCRGRRPVLIVGMPRSGTSLVEQILASHPEVFGAGELSTLSQVITSASEAPWSEGRAFPDCFDMLSVHRANELAGEYLSRLDVNAGNARCVTDKMPFNYLFLGSAEVLLPECRIIHCVRDPRDTCLSCYFTDFGARHQMGFNLSDLAAVYRDYRRLMDHWKKTLTLPMLEVRYEDVVSDQAGQTRRMLAFLDLPWNDRCLSFHETRRPVATASRDQVRRPVYASSVGRWKNYRNHLRELMEL